MLGGADLKITVKKTKLVQILWENLAAHKKIVNEAQQGYLEKAKEALAAKMAELESGKLVRLSFNLPLPEDHSDKYERMIRMLELHLKDSVELTAEDYKCYVENEWSWMSGFLSNNARYSATAADLHDDF